MFEFFLNSDVSDLRTVLSHNALCTCITFNAENIDWKQQGGLQNNIRIM